MYGGGFCLGIHPVRCRAPSRKRYSTSSSTTSTMNQLPSKRAALSPNHRFHAHENTFSLASSSTPKNPMSNCGRRPFRILPTLPLIILATPPFSVSRPSLPRIRMWVVGSALFATLSACAWSSPAREFVSPPSYHSTDYPPPLDRSI